ncbi:hypothetical protein IE53DRAFT_384235 [Violaceomyces palustris]|uniref:Uncharacterized protein n=1 Tax=Violaceomyces palustris TaxID=1673888 RepID=A0ACD0P585_9BASI|nr:hypothetical protein IE53DRAFT_384235 [Violaceomyces palustris]
MPPNLDATTPAEPICGRSADADPSLSASSSQYKAANFVLEQNFDLVRWLNEALSSESDERREQQPSEPWRRKNGSIQTLSDIEVKLRSISLQLSSDQAQSISRMENIISRVAKEMPKLGLSANLVRESAWGLNQRLTEIQKNHGTELTLSSDAVQSHQTGSQSRTIESILERLRSLSEAKSRMTLARDKLREIQAWSTLESDVLLHLSSSKWEDAASRIAEARISMSTLAGNVEASVYRTSLLSNLSESLTESMSESLVTAVAGRDWEQTSRFSKILSQVLDGQSKFCQYYFKTRSSEALRNWKDASLQWENKTGLMNAEESQTMLSKLSCLCSALVSLANEDILHSAEIFQDGASAVAQLCSSAIKALDPSLETFLRILSETADGSNQESSALCLLIRAYKVAVEMVTSVSRAMDNIEPGASRRQVLDLRTRHEQVPARFHDLHPGMKQDDNLAEEKDKPLDSKLATCVGTQETNWEASILNPFLEWQENYGSLEKALLDKAWTRMQVGKEKVVGNATLTSHQSLLSEVEKAQVLSKEALARNLDFTAGMGAIGLVDAIESLFLKVLDSRNDEIEKAANFIGRRIRERVQATRSLTESNFLDRTPFSQSRTFDALDGEGLVDEDWTAFQTGLGLLRTCQESLKRVGEVEGSLTESLRSISETILDGEGSSETIRGSCICHQSRTLKPLFGSSLNSKNLRSLSEKIRLKSVRMHGGSGAESWQDYAQNLVSTQQRYLLPRTRSAVLRLSRTIHRFLRDIVLAPLMPEMEAYASLPNWAAAKVPGSANEYNLEMPSFSLSPTDAVARVGEAMLNLPRLFEVHADDALAFCLDSTEEDETQSGAEDDRLMDQTPNYSVASQMADFGSPSGTPHVVKQAHKHGSLSVGSTSFTPAAESKLTPTLPLAPTERFPSRDHVLSLWLQSLATSLVDHLLNVVLPSIPLLTLAGSMQLAADLDYLANICTALNVTEHSQLSFWKDAVGLSDDEGKRLSVLESDDQMNLVERSRLASSEAFRVVARLRSWR